MNDFDTGPRQRAGNDGDVREDAPVPPTAAPVGADADAGPPPHPVFKQLPRKDVAIVLWGVFLSMFLAAINQTIVAAALPTIGRDLGDFENLSWVVTAYLLTSTAVAPLYGKLADIHGRRTVMLVGIGIFLFGSALCAVAPNMLVLIVGRGLQGLGGGGLLPLAQIIIADVMLPRERGRYQAHIGLVWLSAGVAGPVVGGVIAEHLHWSLIFWINVPIALVGMALSSATLKRLPRYDRKHALDVVGATLMTAAAVALFLALTWGGVRHPWTSLPIISLIAVSSALWIGFGVRLVSAHEPFLPLAILTNPVVRTGCVASAFAVGTSIGLTVFAPLHYELVYGLTASDSGFALIPIAVMIVPGSIIAGRGLMHLVHYRLVPVIFMIIALAATLALVWQPAAPLWIVVTLLGVVSLGLGTVFPVTTVCVQNAVPLHQVGTATGVMNFFRALNSALIVAVMGAIVLAGFGAAPGRGGGADLLSRAADGAGIDKAGVFRFVYLAAAAFIAIAVVALLRLPERPLRGSPARPD